MRLSLLAVAALAACAAYACASSPATAVPNRRRRARCCRGRREGRGRRGQGDDAGDTGGFDAAVPPGDDGGPVRVDVPAIPCEDSVDQAYVTPSGLPPMADDLRGTIVRCAKDQGYGIADAQTAISGKSISMIATSGANVYRILFRTTRADGSAGVSSARVYLPTVAHARRCR